MSFRQCHTRLPSGGWERKVPYATRREARRVASKWPGYSAYRCAHCGAFHVGKNRLGEYAGAACGSGSVSAPEPAAT